MNRGFWDELKSPLQEGGQAFFVQAPMHDVTDAPFRRILAKYGKPDVMFTEFVACDGICSKGRKNLMNLLKFTKKEKPIVAQFFGSNPDHFEECAKVAKKLGFDGIDINMGCPDKTIEKQGAGAVLIKDPKLARKIIRATKKGAGNLPVSVKTRIGMTKNEIKTWIPELLKENPVAITVHGRTKKQGYTGEADWSAIKQVVELAKNSNTLIIGNGDVLSLEDGVKKAKESGVAGVMVGRALIGNPWFFSGKTPDLKERFKVAVDHAQIFEKFFKKRSFDRMKKHLNAYIRGLPEAKDLRVNLMKCGNSEEVEKIMKEYLN